MSTEGRGAGVARAILFESGGGARIVIRAAYGCRFHWSRLLINERFPPPLNVNSPLVRLQRAWGTARCKSFADLNDCRRQAD